MEYKYRITLKLNDRMPLSCKDCKACKSFIDPMSDEEDIVVGECRITYKNNWDYDKKVLESCPIRKDSEGYYIQYDSPYNKCRGCKLCSWTGYLEDDNIEGKCMLTGNKIDKNKADESRDKDCPLIIEDIIHE